MEQQATSAVTNQTPPALNIDTTYCFYYQLLPQETHAHISSVSLLADTKKFKDAFHILDQLVRQFPNHAYLQSYAALTYYNLGKKLTAQDLIRNTFVNHQMDLLVRCAFARISILSNQLAFTQYAFPTFALEELYPGKTNFYLIELAEYFYTIGLFFCRIAKPDLAQKCLQHLQSFLPEQHGHVVDLKDEIEQAQKKLEIR